LGGRGLTDQFLQLISTGFGPISHQEVLSAGEARALTIRYGSLGPA